MEVCTLWGIRLVVLVKKQLHQYINRIQHSTVRTGIANTLGKNQNGGQWHAWLTCRIRAKKLEIKCIFAEFIKRSLIQCIIYQFIIRIECIYMYNQPISTTPTVLFVGNKGAVGISFYFKGTSFCFVNCHLTSGDERNER